MATKRGLQGAAAARIGRRGGASPATAPGEARTPAGGDGASAGGAPAAGILGAIAAAVEPSGADRVEVEVARLAPNPENPRGDVGDVTEIAASIAEAGVLQPLVVVTRAAYLATRPDAVLDPADAEWIVLIGHRRRAGALHAGVATVPIIVRDDLADVDNALITMLVENLQRQDLSPMEEAAAFGRLRERGWSERKIATGTGVSPGQVHKRLSLLRLPAKLVTALTAGDLTIADALRLLELPDDELSSAWAQATKENWRGVRGVVESRLATLRARERAEQLRAALTTAGIELIDDPETEFGAQYWHHKLTRDYTVPGVELPDTAQDAPAAPDDALAHVATYGPNVRLTWYTRQLREHTSPGTGEGDNFVPVGPGASGGSTPAGTTGGPGGATGEPDDEQAREREEQRRAEQRRADAARAAADARDSACARLVTGQLDPELAVEILADTLLVDHSVEPYEVVDRAAEWVGAPLAEFDRDDIEDPISAWLEAQAGAGRLPVRRAAVAVALAEIENALGWGATWTTRAWTARECRHVRRLAVHAGYDLTPDDERRLGTQEGASSGSAPHVEGTPR
ncbi:ParB/RepB/Spo0J family partition protein [Pseudonocardia sp. KRD-184]|uniref:ParB/RepB/Spo0J family partition protein n=1 Tax=Pseudonocardia oceani TaxID=2792013 RepID=A0ABS6UKX7_9PSEU|nr:ParB/RepB/Spo0J family partition protein [Pseudonocardia oceani]MBW0088628.1 ParB/RepB/Spo0J family partition protein [Pseudonocardia oceani]MBW0095471.1 ParB/RepB/Spo0J family partition protein [Pseudonocardia oceani]MBW0120008.1 ParB/RepB/Spo0J family partition protein [Pseudonocardia oceani]MBW0132464.1 ParB/RepB/Spo0J family partition protein [Pseudonocardia oceani]